MSKLLRNYKDFSGGLSEVSNDNMDDNQLALAINTVPGENHGIAKATGFDKAFPQIPGGKPVLEILALKPEAGITQTLAFTSESLYKYDGTNWTSLVTGLSPIEDYFIHAKKLWWLDGAEFRCYDGLEVEVVTMKTAGETPTETEEELWQRIKTSSFVEQRGKRWFFARRGQSEIIVSDIDDPTSFTTTNIINVNTPNADSITALKEFDDGILIFKQGSVHYLEGWDFATGSDIKLTKLNVTSGTYFAKTVQMVENAVLYLGYNGVYRLRIPNLSTVLAADCISENMISDLLAKNQTTRANAVVWDNIYYLTVENEQGIKEYRYYTSLRSFFGEYTMPSYCYSVALEDSNLYLGCANGYILKNNYDCYHYVDINNGEYIPIAMKARTKGFDVTGTMVSDAKVKRVFVVAKQYESATTRPDIVLRADYKANAYEMSFDESLVYGKGNWGETRWGFISTVTKEIPVHYKAKRLQVTISNNSIDEPTLVYGIGVLYKQKRPRGNREGIEERAIIYDED